MTRKEEREQAFFLVFEKGFRNDDDNEILALAKESREFESNGYIEQVFFGVFEHLDRLDEIIKNNIEGWKIDRISKVALALLRLALYEMIYFEKIPVSVSINEAVELAKKYGSPDDASYINGVLGTVSRDGETVG